MTATLNIFKPPESESEGAKVIASHMPQGRAWDKKNESGSNINSLLKGLAADFIQVQQKIFDLAEEFDINLTTDLLPDWETSVGIPDDCVFTFDTLTERRDRVIQRLRNIPVVTLAELQTYIQAFFESHTVTIKNAADSGAFEYEFEMVFTDGINNRFVIVADIDTGGDTDLLRCLLRNVVPANVVIEINEV